MGLLRRLRGITFANAEVDVRVDDQGRLKQSHGQPAPVVGVLDAIGETVSLPMDGFSFATVYVSGTHAGVTISIEESPNSTDGVDGTWFVKGYTRGDVLSTSLTADANITANASRSYNVVAPGASYIRVRMSAYTSGALNVVMVASTSSANTLATVGGSIGLSTNTPIATVSSTTGMTTNFFSDNQLNVKNTIKTTGAGIYMLDISNTAATEIWLQIFALTNANVTVGTTTPTNSFRVPANGDRSWEWWPGLILANALTIAVTTTPKGAVAPATAPVINMRYI